MKLKQLFLEERKPLLGYHRLPTFWMIPKIEKEGFKPISNNPRFSYTTDITKSRKWDCMGPYFIVIKLDKVKDVDPNSLENEIYDFSKLDFAYWGIDLGHKVLKFPWGTTKTFDPNAYDHIVRTPETDRYTIIQWNEDFNSNKTPQEIVKPHIDQRKDWYF